MKANIAKYSIVRISVRIILTFNRLLCFVKAKNRLIVDFISRKWVDTAESQNSFATEHGIDEKTVRRIKHDKEYQISLVTIMKICEAKEIMLSDFFKEIGI
jgi:DNA-binding Xre family transcriptional regulator